MAGLRQNFGTPEVAPDPITEAMDEASSDAPWDDQDQELEPPEEEVELPEGLALHITPLSVGSIADVAITSYGTRELYSSELDDEGKGRRAIIKDIVKLCRSCPEYRRYTAYLRETLDMGKCSVLSGLSDEELLKAGVELHHHPLTLYDICEVVLSASEFGNGHFSLFRVAHRVMALHWRGMVGLVPLSGTMHEMAHDGQLRIDPRSVYGDWMGFIREYESYLNPELVDKIRASTRGWEDSAPELQNSNMLALEPRRWAGSWPEVAAILTRAGSGEDPEDQPSQEDVDDAIGPEG